ncbi:MAG: hypothetical protein ACLU3I_03220 [Acutalibacteraceae bacterium]
MVRIAAAAAAAVAVLCGAAAILHYASVSNEEGTYHAEGVVIRSDGTPNPYSYDFSHDAIIRVDTEGRTTGTYCGMKFDWLPVLPPPDNTRRFMALSPTGIRSSWRGSPTARSSRWKTASIIRWSKSTGTSFSATCLSANEIAGCDLLVIGNDPQITKEGMINGLYASWIEASHETNADVTYHYLLLYDPEKLCVVFLNGDWELTEKIAENMTIVQTDIPTPEPEPELHIRWRTRLT